MTKWITRKLRMLAATAVVFAGLAGVGVATAAVASATSPMPCDWMLGGYVCYQIVGSGQEVDYWWGTNSGPDTIGWELVGPSGEWAHGSVAPHGDWYSFWEKNALKGNWCVYYTYPNQVTQHLCEMVE